ncbi:MAG: tetratricopeptide repeat protein [Planctomycetota bacterium]|nr:MAG: tetratricopeptide repeat protein [Planctomycetota bacterium]
MSKIEFITFIIIILLVLGFLALLVTPRLIANLDVRQSFERAYGADRFGEAERLLAAYRAEQPDSAWACMSYSRLLSRQGRNLDAYGAIMKAINRNPNDLDARLLQVYLITRIGTPGEVGAAVTEYRSRGGSEPIIHTYLGWAYAYDKDYARAEKEYRAYLGYKPDDAFTLRALAEVSLAQGKPDKARNLCGRALRVEPSNKDAQELWRRLTGESSRP